MKKHFVITLLLCLICSTVCSAHPGRTDKYGGHTNKATGEYHYHNADGSVTIAPKPAESTEATPDETTENETTQDNSTVAESITTIVVDGDKKPVQQSVAEDIIIQAETNEKITEADEIIKTTDKNGDTIIYVPKGSPCKSMHISLWILIVILSIIGWCAISPIICILLKKLENKNSAWEIILHVPYLLFWLPSLLGKLFYKLYNRISPKEKDADNMEFEDYDDDYDI